MPVDGLATVDGENSITFWPDPLTAYLAYEPAGGTSGFDLAVTTRATLDDAFSLPTLLAGPNSPSNEYHPTLSADGLAMLFDSDRVVGEPRHLYVAARGSTLASFGTAAELANVNSVTTTDTDRHPFLSRDGSELWFTSNRAGGAGGDAIYVAERNGAGYANPTRVAELDSTDGDSSPVLSGDGLTIYFASTRPGGLGSDDIWMSHRTTTTDGFAAPEILTNLNAADFDDPMWISPDNCDLYFKTRRTGSDDIYVAHRTRPSP